MTKLILDFDGAINAMAPALAWDDYRTVECLSAYGGEINYSPTAISRLRDFNMPVTWCTAWEDMAPTILGPLIEFGEGRPWLEPINGIMDYPTILWKREAVEAFYNADPCAFVWLDDEMRIEDMVWAQQHHGLAIRTPERHGVTAPQLELISDFLQRSITILV